MKLTKRGQRVLLTLASIGSLTLAYWLARGLWWLLTVNLWGGATL
jgi:hypothetical protein